MQGLFHFYQDYKILFIFLNIFFKENSNLINELSSYVAKIFCIQSKQHPFKG